MAYKGKNRRKGPDLIIRVKRIITMTVFAINTVLVFLVAIGKPRNETMFDRFAGKSVAGGWNADIVQYLFLALIFQFVLSLAGIILESIRHKRRRDNYSLLLMASICISVIGMVILIL